MSQQNKEEKPTACGPWAFDCKVDSNRPLPRRDRDVTDDPRQRFVTTSPPARHHLRRPAQE